MAGVEAEGRDDGGADVVDGGELRRMVRVGGEVEAAALVLRPDNPPGYRTMITVPFGRRVTVTA